MFQKLPFTISIVLVSLFSLASCSEDKSEQVAPAVSERTSAESEQETSSVLDEDDGYTVVGGIELDYLFVTRMPEIVGKYVKEFNYHWMRAYNCEYAGQIKNDFALFQSVEAGIMSAVVEDKSVATNRFKALGNMVVYLSKDNRNEGTLGTAEGHKRGFSGSHFKDTDCKETEPLNTRHVLFLKKIQRGQIVDVPDKLLESVKSDGKVAYAVMVIKFTLEDTQYEYYEKNNYFKVKHTGAIDEIALYADKQELANRNPFIVLSADDLYR